MKMNKENEIKIIKNTNRYYILFFLMLNLGN